MKTLFPQPYLQVGSKGPAVVVLQLMLKAMSIYNSDKIIPDGEYGEETKNGVMQFQHDYGLEKDGHFGPATRIAFQTATGIDINVIPELNRETYSPPVKG